MPARKKHLLILGGTAEAAALVAATGDRFGARLTVTTSLAGRRLTPRAGLGQLRIGGFGGAAGLAGWLQTEKVDMVVDATHPFAGTISANARQACDTTGISRLILTRPSWDAGPDDRWREVADFAAAASALSGIGSRVFLSVGSQKLQAFSQLRGVHLVVRMIDAPQEPLPLVSYSVILGRGPFTEDAELGLLRREKIDAVLSRNSGGVSTYAKIVAARRLALPVVMIAPPPIETGPCTIDQEGALQWISEKLAVAAT